MAMRGQLGFGGSVHFLWKEHMRLARPSFEVRGNHDAHPLCRVPGKRKWKCTTVAEEVTCRGCLRAMALGVRGEVSWRENIIKCFREKNPERPRPRPGCAWPV